MAKKGVIDIRNLAGREKFLKKKGIELALNQATLNTVNLLLKNWSRGKGGDDVKLKPYTKEYQDQKREAGKLVRGGTVDLIWSGDLHRSIRFKKIGKLKRVIRPLGAKNIAKMKGLTTQRNRIRDNIMVIGDRLQDIIVKVIAGKLRKSVDQNAKKNI